MLAFPELLPLFALGGNGLISSRSPLSTIPSAAYDRVRDVLDWPHVVDRLLWRTMPEALSGRQPVWMRPPIAG